MIHIWILKVLNIEIGTKYQYTFVVPYFHLSYVDLINVCVCCVLHAFALQLDSLVKSVQHMIIEIRNHE